MYHTPEIADLSYKDYLKTRDWQQKSLYAKQKASHKCQICNCSPTPGNPLEVHHRKYTRPYFLMKLKDLIAICRACHRHIHNNLTIQHGNLIQKPAANDPLYTQNLLPSKEQKDKTLGVVLNNPWP